MTDVYTWIKNLPDILRSYGLLIMSILAISGTSLTGIYQYFDKQEVIKTAEAEKNKAVHEVAIGFNQLMVEPKKSEPQKPSNCGKCSNLIGAHVRRYHQ